MDIVYIISQIAGITSNCISINSTFIAVYNEKRQKTRRL